MQTYWLWTVTLARLPFGFDAEVILVAEKILSSLWQPVDWFQGVCAHTMDLLLYARNQRNSPRRDKFQLNLENA